MSSPRALAPLVCTLALLVSGCGSGEPSEPDSPRTSAEPDAADSPAGVYALVSTITRSTLDVNKPGPESRVERDLFLSCEDEDCAVVFQRAAATGTHGNTVRLEQDGDGLRGAHFREGQCPKGGAFSESISWTWSRTGDGALEGTILQEFVGCELDGTTDYAVTATPKPDARLPYLPEEQARELASVITAYDETAASLYAEHPKCVALGDGTPASQRCLAAVFREWAPAVRPLMKALQGPSSAAQGFCRQAFDKLALPQLATAVEAAADGYTTEEGNTAVDKGGKEHQRLVAVALMCVPPEDYATLGRNGRLTIDFNSTVPAGER